MLRQKEMESEAQMMALQNEKLRAEIQKQRVELEDTSMKLPFSVDAKFIVTFDLPSNQFWSSPVPGASGKSVRAKR
jgi:hypothetical protein